MKYLTTSDIENTYNVSRPTIGKWISDALNKENNLHVGRVDQKIKIIESPHNREVLTQLATSALKYKPKSEVKKVTPKKELYELYTLEQISELYFDLFYKRQINLKNVYKGGGEDAWDNYYFTDNNSIKSKDQELINRVFTDLDVWIDPKSKVNIIDLGPGNGYPIKTVIDYFKEKKTLDKYIPVDISEEILDTTVSNLKELYPGLEIVPYKKDFELDQLSDILLTNKDINRKDVNLVFIIGGTFNNFDEREGILKNIANAFTKEDYFVVCYTNNSSLNRAKISYVNEGYVLGLWEWVISLIGMDFDPKNLEGNYDSKLSRNELYYVLQHDYQITFDVAGQKLVLNLMKNEKLTLWWHSLISLDKLTKDSRKAGLQIIEHKVDTTGTIGLAMFKKHL